ncbi:hypothetical protein GCM10027422_16200 [Hymenobacter arcticus]
MIWLVYAFLELLFVVLPVAAALESIRVTAKLRRQGVRARARIISQRTASSRYGTKGAIISTLRFTIGQEEVITGQAYGVSTLPNCFIGDEVTVVYDARKPHLFLVDKGLGQRANYGFLAFWVCFGLFFTWVLLTHLP